MSRVPAPTFPGYAAQPTNGLGLAGFICSLAGLVLTGGSTNLEGTTELAEEILGMPVRIGFPTGVRGITQLVHGPQYATGVGLVKYGAQAIADAHARAAAPAHSMMRMSTAVKRDAEVKAEEAVPKSSSKLWEWLKAAF